MRHQKSGRKSGRNSSHRKAMFRNMVTSLLRHERITTTQAKAKELRGKVERTISVAARLGALLDEPSEERARKVEGLSAQIKELAGLESPDEAQAKQLLELRAELAKVRGDQARYAHAMAQVAKTVQDREVLHKLFEDIAPRVRSRPGGYTRVIRLGRRRGDAAEMAIIELVDRKIAEADGAGDSIN